MVFDDFDLIHSYSRREAIADGVLVDLMEGDLAPLVREAGFRVPVAVTRATFDRFIALTPAAERAGNDVRGRLWDVLMCLRLAARRAPDVQELLFTLYCVVDSVRPTAHRLKAIIGPDDDGQPCLTVLLPEED